MSRVKSENFWASAAVGGVNQYIHLDAGQTNRVTIVPVKNKPLILCNVVVNTSGSSGSTTITDTGRGIIAQLKASVSEKDYHYQVLLIGSLQIDNNGSDLTLVYVRD